MSGLEKNREYFVQESLNGNAGALEAALTGLNELEDKHILTIQGDDSGQATRENLQNLIHTHLTRDADVSVLAVNKPDNSTHKNEYVYDSEGRITDVIPRITSDSHGSYMAGIFLFSGKFLGEYLPKLKENTEDGKELGISNLIKLAITEKQRVFQCYSNEPYIAVNTPQGLQRLRDSSKNI
jgi:bifunctional N-acetylglucosamine-1-phosphate-uridyltransferase/glucosamine-1-phosphate-acetyltransferase GlmU-like protein